MFFLHMFDMYTRIWWIETSIMGTENVNNISQKYVQNTLCNSLYLLKKKAKLGYETMKLPPTPSAA